MSNSFIKQEGRLRYFSAKSATIIVETPRGTWQICQVGFLPNGHTIVQWPYVPSNSGLLSIGQLTPKSESEQNISLLYHARRTNHKVKYSHPLDGKAHFSQDRKVFTEIRRQSFSTIENIGQMFFLSAFNIDRFKPFERRKPKRAYLIFRSKEPITCVSIQGVWWRKEGILQNTLPDIESIGPTSFTRLRKTGELDHWQFLASPYKSRNQHSLLMLKCIPQPALEGVIHPAIIFMGGLNNHETMAGRASSVIHREIMVAQYPPLLNDQSDFERIPSIDFVPG